MSSTTVTAHSRIICSGGASPSPSPSEPDLLIQTFRSDYHAYDPSTSPTLHYEVTTPILIQWLFIFPIIHYFLWFFAMATFLLIWWWFGYGWVSIVLLLLYLPSFLRRDDLHGGRPWDAFRRHSIWHLCSSYLNVEVIREAKADPKKQWIFALHPHGIMILSRPSIYGGVFERAFPGVHTSVLGATPQFLIPGCRELCLWMGAINAAKKIAVEALTKLKRSLVIYPGGSDEIFHTDRESPSTVLITRKGFIKLSIQNGVGVVPTFVFGEKRLYHKMNIPKAIRDFFMRTLKTPLIIFYGKGKTWVPLRDDSTRISIVFGRTLQFQQSDEPTQQEIDSAHSLFVEEMKRLWDSYKGKFGYAEDEVLVIKDADKEKEGSRGKKVQ